MISTIISLALSIGLPAIVTGILGKWTSWLGGLSALAPFVGVIVKLCVGLIDVLLIVIQWVTKKILNGLDHIVQSVPATATVLLLCWISYGYGAGFTDMIPELPSFESSAPPAPASVDRRDIVTPGDWIRRSLGVE